MLVDMHVHTREVSNCAEMSYTETLDAYKRRGYDAVVITNHINSWSHGLEDGWENFIDNYVGTVNKAKAYGKSIGVKVFFGCELNFEGSSNDYLIYGINEGFLRAHPFIRSYGIGKLYGIVRAEGMLVYQAHPFRDHMTIVRRENLDGIEAFNGHPYHNSRNDIARLWADIHGYMMVAGSDFHHPGTEATAGLLFDNSFDTENELVKELREGNFKMVINSGGGIAPAKQR